MSVHLSYSHFSFSLHYFTHICWYKITNRAWNKWSWMLPLALFLLCVCQLPTSLRCRLLQCGTTCMLKLLSAASNTGTKPPHRAWKYCWITSKSQTQTGEARQEADWRFLLHIFPLFTAAFCPPPSVLSVFLQLLLRTMDQFNQTNSWPLTSSQRLSLTLFFCVDGNIIYICLT